MYCPSIGKGYRRSPLIIHFMTDSPSVAELLRMLLDEADCPLAIDKLAQAALD